MGIEGVKMIIINDDRQSGKTKFCINQAKLRNAYIITGNKCLAESVRNTANFLKVQVDVFGIDAYLHDANKEGLSNKPIIIDELHTVLKQIFKQNEVIIATSDKSCVHICEINDMKYSLNDLRKKYGLKPIDDGLMNLKWIEDLKGVIGNVETADDTLMKRLKDEEKTRKIILDRYLKTGF